MLLFIDFVDSMNIMSLASERKILPSITLSFEESRIIALTLFPLRLNSLFEILLEFVFVN